MQKIKCNNCVNVQSEATDESRLVDRLVNRCELGEEMAVIKTERSQTNCNNKEMYQLCCNISMLRSCGRGPTFGYDGNKLWT